MTGVCRTQGFPCDRQQMTNARRLGCFVLPVAARQTDCSHLPDVSLFRDFILANRRRARDDRPITRITWVSGEVKVVFFHGVLRANMHQILGFPDGNFWSVLLGSHAAGL